MSVMEREGLGDGFRDRQGAMVSISGKEGLVNNSCGEIVAGMNSVVREGW